jgi:hypothetical protein
VILSFVYRAVCGAFQLLVLRLRLERGYADQAAAGVIALRSSP